MTDRIRVLCVDDHSVMRDGIAFALRTQSDMQLVGEATNGKDAVRLFHELRPDVTLMDLQMPGMNGIEAMREIRADNPKARVVVLTTYSGDMQAHRALSAGAAGYLLKHTLRNELLGTIRRVSGGVRCIPAQVAATVVERLGEDLLSGREIEVLQLVSEGNSNLAIADALDVSVDTVKGHMKSILLKLSANDRTHAVTIATARGYLDPNE